MGLTYQQKEIVMGWMIEAADMKIKHVIQMEAHKAMLQQLANGKEPDFEAILEKILNAPGHHLQEHFEHKETFVTSLTQSADLPNMTDKSAKKKKK